MRKKLFTFLLALTASIGMMWAETVVINKSEFTSSGVTKEGVTLALSNASMTSSNPLAMNGSFIFSTSLGKFTGITIETDINIMEINEGAYTSAGWTTGDNLGTSAVWTGESDSVLISCMVAGNTITITCTIEPTSAPTPSGDEGKLPGAFAINGDGDYIAFSKGNLQYHCTNHVWQFATNQYDIIGNGNANISDSYDGWVDLFGYGTGNNPTLVNTSYSAFSTFTDWGVNAISNGGNEANLWRTLTRDEWAYLFNSRANASSKYGMATVANVPGVIVLPDVYEGSAINTDHDGWGNNIISSGDWAAYETAGAVFLPVAGYREGTTVDNLGSYGFYWSSTPEDAMFSKKLSLDQYLVEPEGYGLRYQGLSVRLVTETTPSSGSEPEPTEDAIVIVTKTKQSSYTQSTVTISCAAIGDSDGFSVSIYGDKTATITNSDASKIISKIELVPGYSESYHSYVRANGGTPASSSESLITFTNVNSNNVTLSITNEYIQIKEVRITLADNDDPTPDPTPAPNPSGECGAQGDNLLWELNTSTGVLTITGSGAMNDWPDDTTLPWYDNRLDITSVVLPSGITSIGTKAFRGCNNLASINMTENYPAGLTAINQEAFCNTALTSVTIPESVVTIGQDAFYLSQAITDVYCYADPNNLTWTDFWCDDFNKTPAKSTQCHVKDCYLAVYNSKWNSGSSSTDVNVTFVGDLPGDCGAPTPTNPVIKLNANFGGTYDWADTEAFTDNGDGTATLSNIALTAGYYYNFNVNVGDVWFHNNYEFTRQNPSYVINSSGEGVYYFQADVTGNYSFTWEYATNTLTIGYPANVPTVGMKGSWDDWTDVVNFTDNGDGTASATKSFEHEGYYTFKTVLDGDDWRGNGEAVKRDYTGATSITGNTDMTLWIDAKGEYTFTWTYATNAIGIAYPTLPTIQTKGSWDNWTDALNFTDNGDGTASVTKHFDAEGYHDFKINVGADDWRGNGETFKRDYTGAQWINENGSDMKLYVDEPGDYTFTWSYVENALSITLPAQSAHEVVTNQDPENPSYHYSTFFHSSQNYALTNDGTEAFVADLSGNDLVLTKIAEGTQVIPMNTAVIFRKTGSADPVVLDPTDEAGVSFSANNDLEGVDDATMVTDIAGLTLENCYVLSGTALYGVGFYKINGNQLKAHKAYVKYNGSQNNAPRRMRFVFNQEQVVTGIDNANADIKAEKRIENGQLIIIKNGVRYNAQGQIVR